MNVADDVRDLGYAAGWQMVRALPQSWAVRLFDAGADRAARRDGGPMQLRRNLARVLGVTPGQVSDALIRDNLRSYARYWREAFRLPTMNPATVADEVEAAADGVEHATAALSRGNGVILALPHSGNWDMAGVWATHRLATPTVVAERLRPEALYRRFVRYRESLGFEIIPLDGGHQPPYPLLAERLRQGRLVGLLGERDLTGNGVPVTFFGEPTRMPAGPARLAIATGAPLLPVHCWFTPEGWGFRVEPPLDTSGGLNTTTQRLADRFAANIAAHPADWHMLQPVWPADRTSRSRRAITRNADGTSTAP